MALPGRTSHGFRVPLPYRIAWRARNTRSRFEKRPLHFSRCQYDRICWCCSFSTSTSTTGSPFRLAAQQGEHGVWLQLASFSQIVLSIFLSRPPAQHRLSHVYLQAANSSSNRQCTVFMRETCRGNPVIQVIHYGHRSSNTTSHVEETPRS